jgi:WD40 repeat protein
MSRRGHRTVEQRLRSVRAPQEEPSQRRAWRIARTVYAERTVTSRRRPRARLGLAPAAVAIAGVLALTPAGAAVHRWINQTLGVTHARAALFSLPAPGQVLTAGTTGVWTVSADGSKRRVGSWREATWSPHAQYVAVAGRDQLTAVSPRGTPQWSIARPDVRSPRWFAPNGYRLAYLSGSTLRVIAGDGTGDRQLSDHVSRVAPAWRPGHDYVLAYATANGTIVVRDADTGRVAWSDRTPTAPRVLAWSSDGSRLLVLTRTAALVFDGHGHQLARVPAIGNEQDLNGALSPDGQQLALLSDRDVTLTDLSRPGASQRRAFTGAGLRQLVWSPDGRWLLVGWPAADQWVFIHAAGRPQIIAVSRIAEQFSGSGPSHAFPTLEGWCCTPSGGSG